MTTAKNRTIAMGRPRSKKQAGLPPNLYPNGPNAFKYRRPDDGEWHGMGTDRAKAIAAARQLNSLLMEGADLVAGVIGGAMTLSAFIVVYRDEILPERELATATTDLYKIRLRQLDTAAGHKPIDGVTIKDVADLLLTLSPRSANQMRKLAIDLFAHAAARGLVVDNPAASTLPRIEKKTRKRHTVEGVAAIRAAAPTWLKNAIDLALITAQRRSDILAMRFDDVRDEFLHVVQKKTAKKSNDAWVRMKVTPSLDAVIKNCRDDIVSPFMIHRRPERIDKRQRAAKDHWTQITGNYLSHAFQDARAAAKVYKGWSDEEMPGFHELRALALHLYKKAGKPTEKRRAIAGHADEKMTANYEADHEEIIWSEAEPDLDVTALFKNTAQ